MRNEAEYLSRRLAITEAVILEIGDLLRVNFPPLAPGFQAIGDAWTRQIDALDAEFQQSGQQKGE